MKVVHKENGTPASRGRHSWVKRTALLPPSERFSRPKRTKLLTRECRAKVKSVSLNVKTMTLNVNSAPLNDKSPSVINTFCSPVCQVRITRNFTSLLPLLWWSRFAPCFRSTSRSSVTSPNRRQPVRRWPSPSFQSSACHPPSVGRCSP